MKVQTEDLYKQKANEVIDYISQHLHNSLSVRAIAHAVSLSERQLFRIMRPFLSESLVSYITRQRIERAIMYLQVKEYTLSELASKVGYDNPQSFSKAFKRQTGISPKLYLYKLKFRIQESAAESQQNFLHLPYEITFEKELLLVYIRIIDRYGKKDSYSKTWKKLTDFLARNQVLTSQTRFLGISFDDPNITQPDQCRFYACATIRKKIVASAEYGTLSVPAGKYAVWTYKGDYSGLQPLYNQIFTNITYPVRHGITFEEYLKTTDEKPITKIFIPIK